MVSEVLTKQDTIDALKAHGEEIRKLGVRRLGVFGSLARAQAGPHSDVDLLVEFRPGSKTFDNFMELSFLLEKICERRVDLVTREALSPYIGPHILQEVEYVGLAG